MVSPTPALVCGAFAVVASIVAAQVPATPQSVAIAPQTNATTEALHKEIIYNGCGNFKSFNWDDAKYVCAWWHDTDVGRYANVFIKKYSNELLKECWCRSDVAQYNPWGSRWTYSTNYEMVCYTRDGRSAQSVRSEFDAINCPAINFRYWSDPPINP